MQGERWERSSRGMTWDLIPVRDERDETKLAEFKILEANVLSLCKGVRCGYVPAC